jgi:hypothetical protein
MTRNIRGAVIAVGAGWGACAKLAADAMEQATGVPCDVISGADLERAGWPAGWHPSWGKLWLFEVPRLQSADRLIVFDADLLAVRPWDEWQGPEEWMAARDQGGTPVRAEMRLFDLADYFNTGLLVIDRSLALWLHQARKKGPRYGRWAEQTAVNVALEEVPGRVLPPCCNVLVPGDVEMAAQAVEDGAAVVHFAGIRRPVGEILGLMERMVCWRTNQSGGGREHEKKGL